MSGRLYEGYAAEASWTPVAEAYTAGDVISTPQTFTFTDRRGDTFFGGELFITTVQFWVYHSALISGETSYRVHLYNVTPPSGLGNNDAFDIPAGDRAAHLGYIDLGTPVDIGSTLYVEQTGYNKQLTVPNTGKVFAYLRTIGGFTATAAVRRVRLHGVRL